jgi:hypothetical protein
MNLSQFPEGIEMFPQPILGRVEEPIWENHAGRVAAIASFWPAELYDPSCHQTIVAGASVLVIGIRGITLLIAPMENPPNSCELQTRFVW